MTKFIILSRADMLTLCNDKPVTVYVDKNSYVLCTDEYFEKQRNDPQERWCTECPCFRYVADDMDDSWYGTKCDKDGHEANPSMYAIQSLHDDCPLRSEVKSNERKAESEES